jgi:mRNA interferase MazF
VLTRGDIVLVPFPFTDLSGKKVRPALVVNVAGDDVLVAFISSVLPAAPANTDWVLPTHHAEFGSTGLKAAAVFKLAKLVCLHRSLILRKLGHVTPSIQRELDKRLTRAIGLEERAA